MVTRNRETHVKMNWPLLVLAASLIFTGCLNNKKTAALKTQQGTTGTSAEPDKVLFERATADIQHNRYEEARLSLQTLINTYPDSEYLAKAKLSVGDSYFKQGGVTGYTQAIAEYQDFVTFFPFLDEAAYAQMQIGMAHYRQMEKPDRDRDEATEAEGALQTFLQKYPNSPLFPQAQQRLRDVQEILADGDFRVASFYYLRHVDRASASRLVELVSRYPLYSQADHATWMLASIAERTEHNDIAGQYYAHIVRDYPLSPLAPAAKAKLEKFGAPVPQPDPEALARMQKEQQTPRQKTPILKAPTALLKSAPDVRMAAHSGTPTMTPEDTEGGDVLTPGALGVGSTGGAAASGGAGTGAFVETVTPGASGSASTSSTPAASSSSSASDAGTATVATPAAADPPAAAATSSTSTTDATTGATTDSTANSTTTPSTSKGTSSSKKKKGLKKIVPF
jgi:outer membrane protein assembly factor BamD